MISTSAFNKLLLPMLLLSLVGCTSLDIVVPREQRTQSSKPASKSSQSAPLKSGGYYLDDGPGDNPPADMLSIPDAVPKLEPYAARANKPYIALGMSYTPMTSYQPYKKQGIASWYGRRYHGQKTSIGEVYDMYAMTGAHTTLPLPSYVRVTNPENGKSVIVRINDRGPFHEGRIIDLSYLAAYKLGVAQKGSGWVEVEAIDVKQYLSQQKASAAPASSATISAAAASPAPASPTANSPSATSAAVANTVAAAPAAPVNSAAQTTSEPVKEKQSSNEAPLASGNYVQLGAFRQPENAQNLAQKLRQQVTLPNSASVSQTQSQGLYRVLVGPFDSRLNAEQMAEKIKANIGLSVVIVSY